MPTNGIVSRNPMLRRQPPPWVHCPVFQQPQRGLRLQDDAILLRKHEIEWDERYLWD